jgi:hypothetical protein
MKKIIYGRYIFKALSELGSFSGSDGPALEPEALLTLGIDPLFF